MTEDVRVRLERFMRKYNPEKLSTIDSILSAYSGKEEQMFEALVKKYGPEPPREGAPSAASPTAASSTVARGVPEDVRVRLERFMRKYNPEKLSTIDSILSAYSGKEEQMFEALVKKYGPEPPREGAPSAASPTAASSTVARGSPEDVRVRLERFMRKYNPEKLSTIDSILSAYSGKEEQMFEALVKKYGPEPPREGAPSAASPTAASSTVARGSPEDVRVRLERFMRKYNPEKLSTIDSILSAYSGKEEQMFEALVKKYGPEPPREGAPSAASPTAASSTVARGSPEDVRVRLERFMRKYNPEKLSTIDSILSAYSGKEEQMFEALVKKYGPEPPREGAPSAASPTAASSTVARGSPEDVRVRLERFMRKYNPEKLSTIDSILSAYSGKEEQMFEALVKKYGPEPPGVVTASTASFSDEPQPGDTRICGAQAFNDVPVKELLEGILRMAGVSYEDVVLALSKEGVLEAFTNKGLLPRLSGVKGTAASSTVARGSPEDVRVRLERFMRKYNPEKLSTIDSILSAYSGKEEQMFEALVKKYGPEPPREGAPSAASPTAASSTVARGVPEDVRVRLERFMRKYNPEKLSTIDSILSAYSGKEEQMFEALVKKYGPEPPREGAPSAASPTAASPVGVSLPAFEDVGVVSEPRALDVDALRARLARFFKKYAPEKLAGVDALIEASGVEGVEKLFSSLVTLYGPEPGMVFAGDEVKNSRNEQGINRHEEKGVTENDDSEEREHIVSWLAASGRSAEAVCYTVMTEQQLLRFVKSKYGDYENRIRRFFVRYDPPRLREVMRLLAEYRDREDELIANLTHSLGPEPPRTAPTALTRLISRRRVDAEWKRIDEEKWTDDDDDDENNNGTENVVVQQSKNLTDAFALIKAYSVNEPGDFSGDESAAYPRDEEHWYRLFLHCDKSARVTSENEGSNENSLSCVQGTVEGVEQLSTVGTQSAMTEREHTPQKQQRTVSLRKRKQTAPQMRVTLGNRFGQAIGSLCGACGDIVARSFDALWRPVGPQYSQLLSETVVKDGYLEKLSSYARRTGVKWQRRYFRVNDKGIHYYETDGLSEKPKGYKVFTMNSVVLDHIDSGTHFKCKNDRYYYFAITVNDSNEMFYLRTMDENERRDWVTFMQLALARMRLSTIGHDQNPNRWRARMAGLKEADLDLIGLTQASTTVLRKLKQQQEELQERIRLERTQRELMETQVTEMQKQQEIFLQQIAESKEQARVAEEDADAKCLALAERAASVKQRRLDIKTELEETRCDIDGITQSVVKLQREIIDLENECEVHESRLRQVYSKWRRCEEARTADERARWSSRH